MIVVLLLMIVGGIGLAQAVSDPHQVTLRWLRLGGIIAVTLLAVAAAIVLVTGANDFAAAFWVMAGLTGMGFVAQLVLVQQAKRKAQRLAAAAGYALACLTAIEAVHGSDGQQVLAHAGVLLSIPIGVGLVGGFVMTMLLGHAYLTAEGQMTQDPFRRLVLMLAWLLGLRAVASIWLGLYPYATDPVQTASMWHTLMITARYLVGLVVPAVFTYMIWACVNQRANQSATGILYVAGVLVIIGEGIALGLLGTTGWML